MISLDKLNGRLHGKIPLTPSKSITNRALIINALSEKKFEIVNKATANDSVILERILNNLTGSINVHDAGTACRFLTAYLSCIEGTYFLIGSLVEALTSLGADVKYAGKEGFIPLKISGKRLLGGRVKVDASASSQFTSALMLIAPALKYGIEIELLGIIASQPYIHLTAGIMRSFGADVQLTEDLIRIIPQQYSGKEFIVESDWSAASFWYIMVAMADDAEIFMEGLTQNSLQGDSVIAKIMEQFEVHTEYSKQGVTLRKNHPASLTHFKFDFSNCPDLVIPLAVFCAAQNIPGEFCGVMNLRHKESDRLLAIKTELEKTGCKVETGDDTIKIIPGKFSIGKTVNVYNDHRIAMAFAALSMKSNVSIEDESVVKKSYPEFWKHLALAGLQINT
jgi:3-phosphoshikimate 1-carboxyvinyltransferase